MNKIFGRDMQVYHITADPPGLGNTGFSKFLVRFSLRTIRQKQGIVSFSRKESLSL